MSDEIRRALANFVYRSMDFRGRPATVGKQDGTVFVTDESGNEYKDRIWVTYTDTGTTLNETIVDRNGVSPTPQMPILVQDIRGTPTAVLSLAGPLMGTYSNNGTSYPAQSHSHYLEGPNPDYVEGRRFMPGVVHPSSPPALTVYVEPVFYRYEGTMKVWEGGTTGSLSSYVPVVDDGRIHFVIIALDRSDNSVDIIDGDDVPQGGTILFPVNAFVDYDDVLGVSIAAKYWPLAVVELSYGQTAVKVKHITYDHRLWGGEVGLDIVGLTEDTAPDPTADYLVTYDASAAANKKVLMENAPGIKGNISVVFSQSTDGTVANTVTPTDLFSTGIGSVTLPANTFAEGVVVRVYMTGHVSTTGTPDITFSVELGGTELGASDPVTLGSSLSNVGWRAFIDIACRSFPAAGSIVVSGFVRLGAENIGIVNTSTTSITISNALQIEFLAEWGTADAANTITCQTATIEVYSIVGL